MAPQPLYTPTNLDSPAYHLRYAWTGWTSGGEFPGLPADDFWETLDSLWETDGIRRLQTHWTRQRIQFTCSVQPAIVPTRFTGRIKGRLQHALRIA